MHSSSFAVRYTGKIFPDLAAALCNQPRTTSANKEGNYLVSAWDRSWGAGESQYRPSRTGTAGVRRGIAQTWDNLCFKMTLREDEVKMLKRLDLA
ncbi:MAG: hypothetical protein KJ990_00670 [Proteobacteria bacterium]|nr:hypothetical protein [Pseudomonadota bacterium]MBU1648442.1 hypothetical protein [Pseudomonadota bacterium]